MEKCDFVALDVETANEDRWSVCQVGLAFFQNGEVCDTWKSLVDPETYFDEFNIEIHGITPEMVRGAIRVPQMYDQVAKKTQGMIVTHHTPFDRTSFAQIAELCSKKPMQSTWLDTARVVRRTWEELSTNGWGLKSAAQWLNIKQEHHHDALDDAITSGKILLLALEKSQIGLNEWLTLAYQKPRWNEKELSRLAAADANPNGPLFGEVVVFTGALSITRLEAAKLAYQMGCNIDEGVTQKTTLLVVGDQDIKRLAGYSKSSKHRKAEALRSQGQSIRIIGEKDFFSMVEY